MTMTETPAVPDVRRRLSTTDLALVASFAALIAVASYTAAIPVGGAGVPLTLQTFAVLLAGAVLGPLRGLLATLLYLLLGLAGLPVFAGHTSGAEVFTGATAGYLYTFPLAALVVGILVKYVAGERRTRALWIFAAALVGTVVNHLGGVVGLQVVLGVSWSKAFTIDGAYWLGDIVKAAVVALVAAEVHRAFPALLRR
ncbi:biotin transport system substrate-specific component [Nocardioides terrae]|uniref:Biotin transporter n=1 Tax=Nocardioides terrae TaxID=574651 RepID=A0A1I1IXL4_9ACTN|nr:biotin transporter BioY [Nocardioides terrae]SFC40994.1 biotin transport system substrate-specific component [Nocardioides terrae]